MPVFGLGTNNEAPSAEVVNEYHHLKSELPQTVTHEQLREESQRHWQQGATPPREQHDQTHAETPECTKPGEESGED